jgi:regulator of protease activity HflC (stomatin/prohibitin superfamily)
VIRRITIHENERGLFFRGGRLVRTLDPGVHWLLGGKLVVVSLARRTERVEVAPAHVLRDARAALARSVSARDVESLATARDEVEREVEGRLALAATAYGVHVDDVWLVELRLPRALRRAWKRGEGRVQA